MVFRTLVVLLLSTLVAVYAAEEMNRQPRRPWGRVGAVDHCSETPVGSVSLPADDGPHTEPVEWWYWTGHLEDEHARLYGFQLTFFLVRLGGLAGVTAHVAVTDITGDLFQFQESFVLGEPPALVGQFDLSVAGNTALGGDGQDVLHGVAGEYVLDLDLVSRRAAVLHHGDGFHQYAEGGHTWYYSRERMDVFGSLRVAGEQREVTGVAWFDHQWGDLAAVTTTGWDWFALQLDDDREIMLFSVRGEHGEAGGSWTDEHCVTSELDDADYSVATTAFWTSPVTGCRYPHEWQVEVGGLNLVVQPVVVEQEVESQLMTYWEGACVVSGDATGRAYVELTGYCGSRGGRSTFDPGTAALTAPWPAYHPEVSPDSKPSENSSGEQTPVLHTPSWLVTANRALS